MRSLGLWRPVRLLLHLNVLLALSASSIAVTAAQLVGAPGSFSGACAAFAVVFAVYNFDRIADASISEGRATPGRASAVSRTRRALAIAIPSCLVVALGLAIVHGLVATAWTVAFPALGVAYVAVRLPLRSTPRVKDIPYVKCFYTASCWALLVGLGAAYANVEVGVTASWFAVFIGVRMFASTYLGDIRDARDDADAGIKTIAQSLGVAASHRLLQALHVLSALLIIVGVGIGWIPAQAWVLVPLILIGAGLQAAYQRWPERHELLFDLYDLEIALYAPCLWWVMH